MASSLESNSVHKRTAKDCLICISLHVAAMHLPKKHTRTLYACFFDRVTAWEGSPSCSIARLLIDGLTTMKNPGGFVSGQTFLLQIASFKLRAEGSTLAAVIVRAGILAFLERHRCYLPDTCSLHLSHSRQFAIADAGCCF